MKTFSNSTSTRFVLKHCTFSTLIGAVTFAGALYCAPIAHSQSALPSVNSSGSKTSIKSPSAKRVAVSATPTPTPQQAVSRASSESGASALPSIMSPKPASGPRKPTAAKSPSANESIPARSQSSVGGVSIEGLSNFEAVSLLQERLSSTLDEKVTLTDGFTTWKLTRRALGARLPLTTLIEEARASGSDAPVHFVVELDMARSALRALTPKINRVVKAQHEGVVPPDQDEARRPQRVTLALEGSVLRTERALEATPPRDLIELAVSVVSLEISPTSVLPTPTPTPTPRKKPLPNTKETSTPASGTPLFKAAPFLLSHFSTPYDASISGRTENLRLAAKFINGTVVKPGKTFSTNLAIGQRRASQGWKEAKMFLGGKVVTGMASGICQSSTTAYNAALLAGLPIVERHPHTFRVSYAPASRDAAIYWGSKDMKFRNNTKGPIVVRTYLKHKRFHVELYGTKPIDKEVEISSKILSQTKGVRSEAFRTIRFNGKSKVEKLSHDYYRPYPT